MTNVELLTENLFFLLDFLSIDNPVLDDEIINEEIIYQLNISDIQKQFLIDTFNEIVELSDSNKLFWE